MIGNWISLKSKVFKSSLFTGTSRKERLSVNYLKNICLSWAMRSSKSNPNNSNYRKFSILLSSAFNSARSGWQTHPSNEESWFCCKYSRFTSGWTPIPCSDVSPSDFNVQVCIPEITTDRICPGDLISCFNGLELRWGLSDNRQNFKGL